MTALRSGDATAVGPQLCNDLQPAALSLQPDLRRTLAAGREFGALGAIVSGSGPTCAFLAKSAAHAREIAVSLTGAGVCRAVARASGPAPGRGGPAPGRDVVNLVNLEQVSKAYHEHVLLDRVSLGIAAGQRIGVVGRNGAGKTTLLAALAGTADLDSGRSTRARDTTIGHLAQAEQLAGTVGQAVFGSLPEHEWAADARSRSVIEALLGDIDLGAPVRQLSGGERRRTALAALLIRSYDLLLLDEPTNHLDIEAISWLAGYLRESAGTYVVVTHDRWFLDETTEETWEVAGGQVHSYDGGYSAYVLARAERARITAAIDARRRNLLRKELAWLRRGPPARTSKPRFRIEAATALIADEPPPRDGVELHRLAAARLGKTVIELEDVTAAARGSRAAGGRDLAARPG